ncbi:MAG TPA: serine hydrolase [Bacteroidia bacterium]|jgi:CubicO group peptidase (beta-lactamase class C family)|nr:serine hydrolase [Bacteroidia bacterium]
MNRKRNIFKLGKITRCVFGISLLFLLCVAFAGCKNRYLIKGMRDTYLKFRASPGIDRYHIFHNGIVQTGMPLAWSSAQKYNKDTIPNTYEQFLEKNNTIAYLVIKNDSVCYEKYFNGFSDTSHTNSWSMAKSIVGILIGVAIKEGKIKSVDEKVSDFIPSYNRGLDTLLTIKDLLTMSSGIHFGENYTSPFGYAAKALYGNNLMWLTLKRHCVDKPGSIYEYQSGNTQLLGYILTKATGESLSDYASDKLWKHIGAERPGYWSEDHKNGMEKAFCCFNSNARDFARIGKLMMDSGKWNGEDIITQKYFIECTKGQTVDYYGYQWWIGHRGGHRVIYADGFLSQFIVVIPDEKMIVVRLGNGSCKDDMETYTDLALLMYGNKK